MTVLEVGPLFDVAPVDWWRFVPCATCNARRQEPCEQGGESFGVPARRPHVSRVRMARVLHGTLWLLVHHPEDVLRQGDRVTDLQNDPAFREWAERVRAHVLPKLDASALTVSLVPMGETDIKFAVELGLSIMLDKPIIAVVQPGSHVPERLVRVADRIVEADLSPGGDGAPKVQAAIEAAMTDLDEESA